MFSTFLIVMLPPAILNATLPKYYTSWGLFMARENPSKIYSWQAWMTSFLISELPYALLNGVVYWVIWYWPVGFSYNADSGIRLGADPALTFLLSIEFMVFVAWWAVWLCASAPSPHFVANSMPFHLVVLNLINGILIQYGNIPVIWRYTLYYINPLTYFLDGMIGE